MTIPDIGVIVIFAKPAISPTYIQYFCPLKITDTVNKAVIIKGHKNL
jgi:hypothetical protein